MHYTRILVKMALVRQKTDATIHQMQYISSDLFFCLYGLFAKYC